MLATMLLVLATSCARLTPGVHGLVDLTPPGADELRLTYLGSGGWIMEHRGDMILTAPLFTNPSFVRTGLAYIEADTLEIDRQMSQYDVMRARAILTGHAHYDHLMDVPRVATKFAPDARIVGSRLGTLRDRMSSSRTTPRFQAMLIGAFAFVALLLASAGLYGSLAHEVGRRQRELGVRIALGARRSGVLGLVLRRGMTVALVGLGLGFVASFGLTRVLTDYLYGVEPNDPLTLVGVAAVLVLVSVAACLIPARRATNVDPVEVLRAE
jgi:hypothetical protein